MAAMEAVMIVTRLTRKYRSWNKRWMKMMTLMKIAGKRNLILHQTTVKENLCQEELQPKVVVWEPIQLWPLTYGNAVRLRNTVSFASFRRTLGRETAKYCLPKMKALQI